MIRSSPPKSGSPLWGSKKPALFSLSEAAARGGEAVIMRCLGPRRPRWPQEVKPRMSSPATRNPWKLPCSGFSTTIWGTATRSRRVCRCIELLMSLRNQRHRRRDCQRRRRRREEGKLRDLGVRPSVSVSGGAFNVRRRRKERAAVGVGRRKQGREERRKSLQDLKVKKTCEQSPTTRRHL